MITSSSRWLGESCPLFYTFEHLKDSSNCTKIWLAPKTVHNETSKHTNNDSITKCIPECIPVDQICQIMSLSPKMTTRHQSALTLLTPWVYDQSHAPIWTLILAERTIQILCSFVVHIEARIRWLRLRRTGVHGSMTRILSTSDDSR